MTFALPTPSHLSLAMARVPCSQCGADLPLEAPLRYFYDDKRMCNLKCMHDAGSRAHCRPGCGCTAYAFKRRMLREHRHVMRCMQVIINKHRLKQELTELWLDFGPHRNSRNICLDWNPELDELSDAEDPEQQLRAELADRSAMIQAVQGALECLQAKPENGRASNARGNDHPAH